MRKYDSLKIVVIVQAVSMVALSIFVMWSFFPQSATRQINDNTDQLSNVKENRDEVIAEIANTTITKGQLIDELLASYGDQALQDMLLHEAINIAAKERGITLSDTELSDAIADAASGYSSINEFYNVMKETAGLSQGKVIESIRDHAILVKIAVQQAEISEADIDSYVDEFADNNSATQLQLRWIVTEEETEANLLLSKLSDGESFEQLASLYSIDKFTANIGGQLGEISIGDPFYNTNMLEEASELQVGDIAGPIEVDEGFAVIQLMGRIDHEPKSEAQLREWARTELALQQASLSLIKEQLLNEYVSVIRK